MKTDSQPQKTGKAATSKQRKASSASLDPALKSGLPAVDTLSNRHAFLASLDLRSGRKCSDLEGSYLDICSEGRIAQSATKREAVLSRRTWPHLPKSKATLQLAGLEARARAEAKAKVTFLFLADLHSRPVKPSPVAREVFTGRVDNISNGTAFVTLFSQDGEVLIAQWPEQDLAKESIGKSDLFELTMTDSGEAVIPSIRKIPRKLIPDELWAEIQRIKEDYSDLLAEDSDGDDKG